MRICGNCWRGNLASNRVLYTKYGITMAEPTVDAETFIERCFGTVFFFVHTVPAARSVGGP